MGGTLAAIYFARRGFRVDIYESRENLELLPAISNRSINQSLTVRGVKALKEVDLWEDIKKLTLEEKGRVIHQKNKKLLYQPYGEKQNYTEWSINRNDLNKALLKAAKKYPSITTYFNVTCEDVEPDKDIIHLKNLKTKKVFTKKIDILIGADGIHSNVRKALVKRDLIQEHLEYLDWGYKNIYISTPPQGELPFKKNAFHLWSKKKSAIFGIPNSKGFFTCTLTLPLKGKGSFTSIRSRKSLVRFFDEYFPDLSIFIPSIADDFLKNRVCPFANLYTSQWYYKDSIVLLGDAAHAVTIFYGQGINAAFEDCKVLAQCIDSNSDYEKAFATYQGLRKAHTDVLADICKKRFTELKDKYESHFFIARSNVDLLLERLLPNTFHSLYTLIVHTDLPYHEAVKKHARKKILKRILGADILVGIYTLSLYFQSFVEAKKKQDQFFFPNRLLGHTEK